MAQAKGIGNAKQHPPTNGEDRRDPQRPSVPEGRFALENADNSVRTWEDWTNRYRPVILNPPVPFDAYEPWAIDFKSPAAATRSYWHALFVGKAEALITHADESGRAWLQTQLKVDVQHPKLSYALFTNLSRITILLTATNQFGGKDYAVVLSRVEALLHPLTNRVAFSMDLFRREGGLYLISNDLSLLSPFRAVTVAARANGANLLPYPQFYEQVKHSAFPPHFYTIKE